MVVIAKNITRNKNNFNGSIYFSDPNWMVV